MNPDIERLAKEAGAAVESWLTNPPKVGLYYFTPEQLAKLIHLAAEECAKECDKLDGDSDYTYADECAAAIRAKFALSSREDAAK